MDKGFMNCMPSFACHAHLHPQEYVHTHARAHAHAQPHALSHVHLLVGKDELTQSCSVNITSLSHLPMSAILSVATYTASVYVAVHKHLKGVRGVSIYDFRKVLERCNYSAVRRLASGSFAKIYQRWSSSANDSEHHNDGNEETPKYEASVVCLGGGTHRCMT